MLLVPFSNPKFANRTGSMAVRTSGSGLFTFLKGEHGHAARHRCRNYIAERLWLSTRIQQSISHEDNEMFEFILTQLDWHLQQRIERRQYRGAWTLSECEI